MNKYAARGILLDAIDGKRILVLTVGVHEITHVFGELNEQLGDSVPAQVRRQRDAGVIDITGAGRVAVTSFRHSLRGMSFDVVDLDTGVDAERRGVDHIKELFAASPAGTIVRA